MFLAFFLTVNLATGARYPFVWEDEVSYTDPAVNLLLGQGFTNTSWMHSSTLKTEFTGCLMFHALHPFLLYLWFKVFGFSILAAARSINYFYFAAALLLVWRSCLRLGLVASSAWRLVLLALLSCGFGTIFNFRCGRYDCLTILIAAALIYSWSVQGRILKYAAIFSLGLISSWAGLQLLPLYVFWGALLWFFVGKEILPRLVALFAGAGIGLLGVLLLYYSEGVLGRFRAVLEHHGSTQLFKWILQGKIPGYLISKDYSFMVLFVLAAVLARRCQFKSGRFKIKWRCSVSACCPP